MDATEWLHSIGNVPLSRVVFHPPPGTATEGDLLRFVERDKRLCELIGGTLVEKAAGVDEWIITANLVTALGGFALPRKLGAVGGANCTLRMAATGHVRLPDVCFIAAARLPKTREPVPTLAPDLAVEVLSESNTRLEIEQKLNEYFRSGTRLVWIVDRRSRTVEVYHTPDRPIRLLRETDQLEGEHVLPGFTVPVADLFQNVPPT